MTVMLVDPDPAWIYQDIPGFCKSATLAEIASHGHVLTPGRYVGAEEVEDDGEPFDEKNGAPCVRTERAVCRVGEIGESDQGQPRRAGVW